MIQGQATEDIEGDSSNSSLRGDQATSAGAHGTQDDHEEEVFGTQYPVKTSHFVQIPEADLVRGDSQILKSQQSWEGPEDPAGGRPVIVESWEAGEAPGERECLERAEQQLLTH